MHPGPAVHLVISTHTTRHLRRVLLGAMVQRSPADSVILSCDTDDSAIRDLAAAAASERSTPVILVQRPHTGAARLAQVRNNAVRALRAVKPDASGAVVFLDGDCVADPGLVGAYRAAAAARTLLIAYRYDLTPEQTDAFDENALLAQRRPVTLTPGQHAALARRARRCRRQALLRRLGLAKGHKPKLLGANFGVWLDDYAAINGCDEQYLNYGQEDDDLGRRLYDLGCRPAILIDRATVYHQHHPTRAPADWHASPNAARFAAGHPTRCLRGLDNALDQPPLQITVLGPALPPRAPAPNAAAPLATRP